MSNTNLDDLEKLTKNISSNKKKNKSIDIKVTLTNNFSVNDNNTQDKNTTMDNREILYRFLELIMFWYATKFNQFRFRFTMMIYFTFISILYFATTLFIIEKAKIESNFQIGVLITISLVFLYTIMLSYINHLLNTKFYLDKVHQKLKKHFFKPFTNEQKILLFLQRSFNITIHDHIANRRLNIDSNKEFKKMINKQLYDEHGRNLIVGIFLSLFFIIYIELFSNILISDTKLHKIASDINTTIQIKDNNATSR
jgi:hypothetical protein